MLWRMRRALRRQLRRSRLGFTLVELMATVAIVGVLAAICITLLRRHMRAASTVDAVSGMQALRAAEEAFKAENGRYLNCSRTAGPAWYPMVSPGKQAYTWVQVGHPDYVWWSQLPYRRELTRFGYLANAGLPSEMFAGSQLTAYTFPATTAMSEPWYVIQLKGDRDENGKAALGLIHSFSADTYLQDEDE